MSQVTSQSAALQTQLKTTQTQLTQVQNANTLLQSKLTAAQLDADTLRAQLGTWYAWARTIPSVPSFTGGPSIILSSASGTMGATVTVTGSGLPPSASGIISFDMNRNGIADPGETLQTVNTSSGGAFSTSIVVPSLAPGAYSLQAAFPAGTAPQASTNFSVTG